MGLLLAVGSLLIGGLGCQPAATLPPPPLAGSLRQETVIAQGLLLPASGIIQLSAAPGDVVAKRLVEVGQQVDRGQPLLEMRSQAVNLAQLQTLRKRRQEAQRQQQLAVDTAQRQLAAAELRMQHLQAQQADLQRQAELLKVAQQQVVAAQAVLERLEAIADNAATSQYVGQLEIERQRISVAQAELEYQQQQAAQRRSEADVQWALRAAEAEREAAQEALTAARNSQALEILDLEIEAAVAQDAATRITAPSDGVVLAIHATAGEASLPQPLIELADLDSLVVEVEINALDAGLVQVGQTATITAPALGEQRLQGRVSRKFPLVGRPQLRAPDPLARVDYRSVTALVDLEPAATQIARDWLQLQVEVAIDVGRPESQP